MTRIRSIGLIGMLALAVCGGSGSAWAIPDGKPVHPEPRTLVVAADGTGDYRSIQDAIDEAQQGDTVRVKAGEYHEDVTIHSKDRLKLVGDGVDRVKVMGRERVGVFHIGKWPYGATDIEISGLTIQEHGGHAMGIFNGHGVVLRHLKINGMLFAQQVQGVRIEDCEVGGSETTGIQFADSQAVVLGNFIHDNDHGVLVAGKSDVRLERNLITRSLFEGVVVTDGAKATVVNNTIVKNGGGVAFLRQSQSEASGNIIGFNKVGLVMDHPTSRVKVSYNALYNNGEDYRRISDKGGAGAQWRGETDVLVNPQFIDAGRDDFRLQPESPLIGLGTFPFLGALPPVAKNP